MNKCFHHAKTSHYPNEIVGLTCEQDDQANEGMRPAKLYFPTRRCIAAGSSVWLRQALEVSNIPISFSHGFFGRGTGAV